MEPIVLNVYGETLGFDTSFATADDKLLDKMSLYHVGCSGNIRFHPISGTHMSIFCSSCGRIPDPAYIPVDINTPNKLRQWCLNEIEKQKQIDRILSQLYVERMQMLRITTGQDMSEGPLVAEGHRPIFGTPEDAGLSGNPD